MLTKSCNFFSFTIWLFLIFFFFIGMINANALTKSMKVNTHLKLRKRFSFRPPTVFQCIMVLSSLSVSNNSSLIQFYYVDLIIEWKIIWFQSSKACKNYFFGQVGLTFCCDKPNLSTSKRFWTSSNTSTFKWLKRRGLWNGSLRLKDLVH